MPKPQKPIDRRQKMTRVTFTAKTEVLEWARGKASSENRSFANWLAWVLEKEKNKCDAWAANPAIPTGVDNADEDPPSAASKRRASGEPSEAGK
jgi:hypothetical protein